MVSVPIHLLNLMVIDAYALRDVRAADAAIRQLNRDLPVRVQRIHAMADTRADAMQQQFDADSQAIR